MQRVFDLLVFRLRQQAWLVCARLRTWKWRILGMQIGKGTVLPRIHVNWPRKVALGARCMVEDDVRFKIEDPWRDGPSIVIGDATFLGSGCDFNSQCSIHIGRQCMIAAGVRFVDTDHGFADRSKPMFGQPTTKAPIRIADDVWLGANAIILKGVTIGRGAIIGAGAVVTRSIPEYEIWGGVPARRIGVRPEGA